MEIVKIDGYYKAFCQNRWVQLEISQNRWVQLHPLTHSNEGPAVFEYLIKTQEYLIAQNSFDWPDCVIQN